MKQTHTKGPWKWTSVICGSFQLFVNRTPNAHFATVKFTNLEDCAEDEANAKLIAAAPDLLEACKALVKSHGAHGPCEEHDCRACEFAYKDGLAAITKATE